MILSVWSNHFATLTLEEQSDLVEASDISALVLMEMLSPQQVVGWIKCSCSAGIQFTV